MGWCQPETVFTHGSRQAVDTLGAPATCSGREFAGHHRPTQRGALGQLGKRKFAASGATNEAYRNRTEAQQ